MLETNFIIHLAYYFYLERHSDTDSKVLFIPALFSKNESKTTIFIPPPVVDVGVFEGCLGSVLLVLVSSVLLSTLPP